MIYETRTRSAMDVTNADEKRDSVRADLRAEVQFFVLEAQEYETAKDQGRLEQQCGRGFLCPPMQSPVEEGGSSVTGATVDPSLVDFLLQIEDKLDRILKLLEKHGMGSDVSAQVGEGLDISGSGMRLLSEKEVKPGQILDARFRVLRYPVISLQVFGKVVRVQPTEKGGTKLYEIALEFVDLDKDIKEWIISYVFQKQRETIRSEKRRGHG
jgi:hypothetical protein